MCQRPAGTSASECRQRPSEEGTGDRETIELLRSLGYLDK